jgi:hypothetical protein
VSIGNDDREVIDRIVRGEKLADSLVGVNQIAAQAINISSSPAPAGVEYFQLWHFSDTAFP